MDEQISLAKALVETVRYSGDQLRPMTSGNAATTAHARNNFFHDGLQITPAVTPGLANRLDVVCTRLKIPRGSVEAFIYASPEIQGECFAGSTESCVLRFSSALVELLDESEFEFVVGHEIGHFLLDHGIIRSENDGQSIEFRVQERAQEVSADRIGMIACESLEVAIRALMKTVSGLSNDHLRFDVSAFVSQLRNVPDDFSLKRHFTTHPSMIVRCRALLWFSLNDPFSRGIEHFSAHEFEVLNKRIERDLDKYVNGPEKRIVDDAKENLALWLAASCVISDGKFRRADQVKIAEMFGEPILEHLKGFLADRPATDACEAVFNRMKIARDELERIMPMGFQQSFDEIQVRVSQALN